MKKVTRKYASAFMALCMVLSLFAGVSFQTETVKAATNGSLRGH